MLFHIIGEICKSRKLFRTLRNSLFHNRPLVVLHSDKYNILWAVYSTNKRSTKWWLLLWWFVYKNVIQVVEVSAEITIYDIWLYLKSYKSLERDWTHNISNFSKETKGHEVMIIIMMICVQECHSGCGSFSWNYNNYQSMTCDVRSQVASCDVW